VLGIDKDCFEEIFHKYKSKTQTSLTEQELKEIIKEYKEIVISFGFEIPEEYTLRSQKDCLMSLSLVEYNNYISKNGIFAEYYQLECIKNHLVWGSMTKKKKIIASTYNKINNSIDLKEGFIFIHNRDICGCIKVQNETKIFK
jgi:hypothetical protein